MKPNFKTYPECKDCEVFQKFLNSSERSLACETARAIGRCAKDQWKEAFEKKIQESIEYFDTMWTPRKLYNKGMKDGILLKLNEILGGGQ